MMADPLATANSGNSLCAHSGGLCLFPQPHHLNESCQLHSQHPQDAAQGWLRSLCPGGLVRASSILCSLRPRPSSPFESCGPLTFPSVPFSAWVWWPLVSENLCSHQKPQVRCQQFILLLEGPLASPMGSRTIPLYWPSAFFLFAFILLFWPRHLSF